MMSQCWQIQRVPQVTSVEAVTGTKGIVDGGSRPTELAHPGRQPIGPLRWPEQSSRMRHEHEALIKAIRDNTHDQQLAACVAESTLTAIMGRMSAYTGQTVTWEQALASPSLMPANLAWDMTLPVPPVAQGRVGGMGG